MDLRRAFRAGLLLLLLMTGCGQWTTGKVPLTDGKLPPFFKVGETTIADVRDRYGEPPGYRELGNRSVMIYRYTEEKWIFFPLKLENYRIFLVFEDNVLKKADVQKLGWKFTPWFKGVSTGQRSLSGN